MTTEAAQQAEWDAQQLALKENLKAMIDGMLITKVDFDLDDNADGLHEIRFTGRHL